MENALTIIRCAKCDTSKNVTPIKIGNSVDKRLHMVAMVFLCADCTVKHFDGEFTVTLNTWDNPEKIKNETTTNK